MITSELIIDSSATYSDTLATIGLLTDEYNNALLFGDYLAASSYYIATESLYYRSVDVTIYQPSEIIINPEKIFSSKKIYKIDYKCSDGQNFTQTYFYRTSSISDLSLPFPYDPGDPRNYPKSFKFNNYIEDNIKFISISIYTILDDNPLVYLYALNLKTPNLDTDNPFFDDLHLVYNKLLDSDDKIFYLFESINTNNLLPVLAKWENYNYTQENLNVNRIDLRPYRLQERFETSSLTNIKSTPMNYSYEYIIDSGYAYRNNIQIINDVYYMITFDNKLIELGKFSGVQDIFRSNTIYLLSANPITINEGSSVTFTLSTNNLINNTLVPYTIYGITQNDLSVGSLTGNFNMNNNLSTITITLSNDFTTEGVETATLLLDNGKAYTSVTINDTSVGIPTYSLIANPSIVNEGSSVIFTLNTTNVADNTLVPYTITGITQNDLSTGSLNGNFYIINNTSDSTIVISNDLITEGTETATLSLNNGKASTSVTINDTSLNPVVYYTLAQCNTGNYGPNQNIAYEGSVITFILNVTGLSYGASVPYTITGITSSDLSFESSLTGNFILNNKALSNSYSAVKLISLSGDQKTEGNEILTMTVNNQQVSASLNIIDTSKNGPIKILFTAWN